MMTTRTEDELQAALHRLGLCGLLANWEEIRDSDWLPRVIDCEQAERQRRSLERRLGNARLKTFKPMADFDWQWPKKIDRGAVEDLFTLDFLNEVANVVLIGPNGTGKTMIAKNLAHFALLHGHTACFTSASAMLNDLTAQDSTSALERRLRHYCRPSLLVVDELGYLSYNSRSADLLFEIVTRRYHERSTVVTTNKAFADWKEVFPNAGSVVALVDRLVHRAEIISIEGESYRFKEARERAAQKARTRKATRPHSSK
ncbi:MAG: IS21-like element helper ATPase IstB [Polyangiaceae bacterium]|jgi:DNA replication protein DnaC|nr:IS21-like element helper ATPase IstB [Polyangiaceae bacterium]